MPMFLKNQIVQKLFNKKGTGFTFRSPVPNQRGYNFFSPPFIVSLPDNMFIIIGHNLSVVKHIC